MSNKICTPLNYIMCTSSNRKCDVNIGLRKAALVCRYFRCHQQGLSDVLRNQCERLTCFERMTREPKTKLSVNRLELNSRGIPESDNVRASSLRGCVLQTTEISQIPVLFLFLFYIINFNAILLANYCCYCNVNSLYTGDNIIQFNSMGIYQRAGLTAQRHK